MKRLKNIFILVILSVLFFVYKFHKRIIYKFENDPGSYLIQLICMLIPLFVTFYFYFVESRQRKIDNEQQRKQIVEQQESQERIIDLLDSQNKKQIELYKNLKIVSKEINNIRRPKGLSFIYKYYKDLQKNVSHSDKVQQLVNIIARNESLGQIQKEWDSVEDDEIPLRILREFNNAKFFLTLYRKLLFISWCFIVEQNRALKESNDPFHIALNSCVTISELVSKGIMISRKFTDIKLGEFIDEYKTSLESIAIRSVGDLKLCINWYSGVDEKMIEEEFIKDVEAFQSNIKDIYSCIFKQNY